MNISLSLKGLEYLSDSSNSLHHRDSFKLRL